METVQIKPVVQEKTFGRKALEFTIQYSVTILFLIICIFAIFASKMQPVVILSELLTRLTRNSFLVLSLIIPVLAGMGLNFSITIGAMAAQFALIWVVHWGITGIAGIVAAVLISIPFAIFFGYFTGKALNKTRGQEMIASMIIGFLANGLYQFLFLFAMGLWIPIVNPTLILSKGFGVRTSFTLKGTVGGALDNVYKMPLFSFVIMTSVLMGALFLYRYLKIHKNPAMAETAKKTRVSIILAVVFILLSLLILLNPFGSKDLALFANLNIPVVTSVIVALLCVFSNAIINTKLGQDFRSCGQDQHISKISGIHVDRVRIIAIVISTVLAAIGQIIFLQNMGVVQTYGSHVQIALFSVAALLVGGASVSKATVGQALLGVVLFHTLFIVSPMAGKELLGDAQNGEYIRSFVAYGVIGLSLGLHAWKTAVQKNQK
jgi:simple sugar transport system permease protein